MGALELISYEGDNNELVTKLNIEDLRTKSSVIVHESQEALFFKEGQALDSFGPGRHELTTDSLPFFTRVFKNLFGTNSPLPCSVYFVNKVNVLDMRWGTSSAIPLEDPKYHLIIGVGAYGSMGIRIADARKFVIKVVGQLSSYSADSVQRCIKGVIGQIPREYIANAFVKNGVSILEIQTQLMSLSEAVKEKVNERTVSEWGIEVTEFRIESIAASDADLEVLKRTREKELASMADINIEATRTTRMGTAEAQAKLQHGIAEAQIMIAQGKAEKEVMDTLGDAGWSKLQSAEILKTFAENAGGAGGLATAGAGFGIGMAMSGPFANLANQMISPLTSGLSTPNTEVNTSTPQATNRFEEQREEPTTEEDPVEVLGKLKKLFDAELITEEEFLQKKKEILARM